VSGPSRFRRDIEGLRGVAVVLVVAQHAWGFPTGGFVGVDVFFVISGYVITAGLLREHDETGTISFRAFYTRRVRRLLPAALLVVVVTVLVARLVFYTPRFLQVLWDAGASIVSVENWRLIRLGADYFQEGSASPLQHYWSLSVEEQFYVFWPILLFVLLAAVRRRRAPTRPHLAAVIGVGIALSFVISVLESMFRPGWAYFSLESRAWELGVGALLAVAAPRLARLPSRVWRPVFVLGCVCLVSSAVLLDGDAAFPGPWGVLPVLGAAAVIAAGEGRWPARVPVLENPLLTATGRVSYSLYLWHFPAVVFAGTLLWWSAPLAGVVAVAVSVLLAALTVRFVERPFRRPRSETGGAASPRIEIAVAALAVVALVAVVGVQMRGPGALVDVPEPGAQRAVAAPAGGVSAPLPFVDDDILRRAVDRALGEDTWPAGSGPETVWPSTSAAQVVAADGCLIPVAVAAAGMEDTVQRCSFGAADSPRTAVVMGDSIAASWLPGVVDALVPDGWRVVGLGVESCPAVDVETSERVGRAEFVALCASARNEAMRRLRLLDPDLVVLSSSLGSFDRLLSGAHGEPAVEEWRLGLEATLDHVGTTGARVVVLQSPPETSPVAQCASPLLSAEACEGSPSGSWSEKAIAEQAAVERAGGDVSFVPVGPWFCDGDGRCPAAVDGTIVTVDGGHLTDAYSRRLSLLLRACLLPSAA
jgi:peptidoglycan/LPS O-acetylase OafA/YrhL